MIQFESLLNRSIFFYSSVTIRCNMCRKKSFFFLILFQVTIVFVLKHSYPHTFHLVFLICSFRTSRPLTPRPTKPDPGEKGWQFHYHDQRTEPSQIWLQAPKFNIILNSFENRPTTYDRFYSRARGVSASSRPPYPEPRKGRRQFHNNNRRATSPKPM